jgi:hypothetical protein
MVYVPTGVVEAVVILIVEVKLGVPDAGEKVALAPDGRPEVDRLTVFVNPAIEVTETVAVVEPPCMTDAEAGLTDTLKSGVGGTAGTVRATVFVFVNV